MMRSILRLFSLTLALSFALGYNEAQPTEESKTVEEIVGNDPLPKKLSPLEFSDRPGSYLRKKNISIYSREGGKIHFSFSASPSINSEIYSTPIPVYTTRHIYAFATLDGFQNSDTISGLFYADTTSNAKWNSKITYQTFVDSRDGKEYKFSRIGKQVWMSENLNYSNNGEGRCMGGLPEFCNKYGRLYTWKEAVKQKLITDSFSQDLCPEGWRIPKKTDWDSLNLFLMSTSKYKPNYAFGMFRLNANGVWKHDSIITDEYGFRALPADYLSSDGSGGTRRDFALWWSSSDSEMANAWAAHTSHGTTELIVSAWAKGYWLSVRCLQN